MSLFNFFTQAANNAAVLMLASYESKKQAQNTKYFDISNFVISVPYQSKITLNAYRCFEYFDVFDYSDLYRQNLIQADVDLSVAKIYLIEVLSKWGDELSLLKDYQGSAEKYEEVYHLTGDNNYRAIALNALGNYEYFNADYQKAISYYTRSISFSDIDDNNKIFKKNLIHAFRTWAQDLFYQDQYHEASKKYLKAYELAYNENISDLNLASQKLIQDKKFDEAIILNDISFYIAKTNEEKSDIQQRGVSILESWGNFLFAEGMFRKSGQKYLKAYEISHNLDYQMLFFVAKAEELRDKKMYHHALEAYDNALNLAIGDIDIATIYFGKSLVLRCLSENLRENSGVASCSNSKILEEFQSKKKDFIQAIQTSNNLGNSEVALTKALYDIEKILTYFPDLDGYAKAADEARDLLSIAYNDDLLLGDMQEYQFETNG